MPQTFHVANFGCRASQSEGASIQEELDCNGLEVDSAFDANVVIVNSCTVTEEADRQVRQLIRRVATRNPSAQIIVTGCYAQRAPKELAALPAVRYVIGNSHKSEIGRLAMELFREEFPSYGRAEILCSSIFLEKELKPASHLGSGGRTRAVVKIQDGCNANCSFCVIPSVRGRSRSIAPPDVVAEVEGLIQRGYKEIVFSGIHLGTYGRDLSPKTTFHELLLRVVEVPALQRLRLSSIEPMEVTPGIMALVATHPRIARHFHIPLQSGSHRVLREMRRPYEPGYYADLLAEIRRMSPEASIGADVMVGFPGETDSEFTETYRLIETSPLTYLHVFPFSARPGTVAENLSNPVPEHVASHRARLLRQLIEGKNEAFRRSMLGSDIEVLVLDEEPSDGWRSAIADNFVRTRVPAEMEVNLWQRVHVDGLDDGGVYASKITTAHDTN
jgi:threonylcarbamoyladenosine tRNA methylthiotransferase MtaB